MEFINDEKKIIELYFYKKYAKYDDEKIVNIIIGLPDDEETALYLIYSRYSPLLRNIYRKAFENDISWYGDCINDLFLFFLRKDLGWNKLKTFRWESRFSTWLSKVAYSRFLEIRPMLIGKVKYTIYVDGNYNTKLYLQLLYGGVQDYERREKYSFVGSHQCIGDTTNKSLS